MYFQTAVRASKTLGSLSLSVTCDLCSRNFDLEDIRVHLESFHPDSHKSYTVIEQIIHHFEKTNQLYSHLQPPYQPTPTIKNQKVTYSSKNFMYQTRGSSSYIGRAQYPPRVVESYQTQMNAPYFNDGGYLPGTYDVQKGENMVIARPQQHGDKGDFQSGRFRGEYQIDKNFQSNYIVDVKSNQQKSKVTRRLVLKPIQEPNEYLSDKEMVQAGPYKIYLNRETLNFRTREAGSRTINVNERGEKKFQASIPSLEVSLKKSLAGYQKKPINYQQVYINQKQFVEKGPHLPTTFMDQDQLKKQPSFYRVNQSRAQRDMIDYKKKILYVNEGYQVRKNIDQDQLKKQPPSFYRVNQSRAQIDRVDYKKKVLYVNEGGQVRKQPQKKFSEYRFEPNKSKINYQKQPPINKIMFINQKDKQYQQPQEEIRRDIKIDQSRFEIEEQHNLYGRNITLNQTNGAPFKPEVLREEVLPTDKKVIRLNKSKAQYATEKEKMKRINVNQEQKKQKMEYQAPSQQILLAHSQVQYHGDLYVKQLTLNEKEKKEEVQLRPQRRIQLNKSRIYYDQENPEKKQIFLNLYQESERINLPEYQYHHKRTQEFHPVRDYYPITHQQQNYKNSYILQSNVVIKEKKEDYSPKQKQVIPPQQFKRFFQKPQLRPERACQWIEQLRRDNSKNRLRDRHLGTSKAQTDINKSKMINRIIMRIYNLTGKQVGDNQAQKCIQAYENRKTNQSIDQFILKYF